MTPVLVAHEINALAFFRRADLPSVEPMRVRIIGHDEAAGTVLVTTVLDAAMAAEDGTCFDAMPEELHFELDSFEPPSSGSAPTIPAPPPSFEEGPPTSRSPMSAAVSDRMFSIDVVAGKR